MILRLLIFTISTSVAIFKQMAWTVPCRQNTAQEPRASRLLAKKLRVHRKNKSSFGFRNRWPDRWLFGMAGEWLKMALWRWSRRFSKDLNDLVPESSNKMVTASYSPDTALNIRYINCYNDLTYVASSCWSCIFIGAFHIKHGFLSLSNIDLS